MDGDRLDARYLTGYGEILDRFTILKRSTTGVSQQSAFLGQADLAPNPFQSRTSIGFALLKKSLVRIDVLDMSGKIVHSVPASVREPGNYRDEVDMKKAGISEGIYIIRLNAGGASKYLKAVKAK